MLCQRTQKLTPRTLVSADCRESPVRAGYRIRLYRISDYAVDGARLIGVVLSFHHLDTPAYVRNSYWDPTDKNKHKTILTS